ncbi:MAG: radical SAM protein, partial [Clostridia bacterium]|nr:radical SAM protein [Clostridia bacterium]
MCGLYIHIPFCIKKCKYCDFNSFSNMENLFEDYFACIKKEIDRIKTEGLVFDTVYIGGGTPTAVPNHFLTEVIKSIENRTENCEITVECNPGTVSKDDLENLKKSGATRLSIGLQSTDDEELKNLGRIHNLKDFEDCYNCARQAGFDNISIDIMFG